MQPTLAPMPQAAVNPAKELDRRKPPSPSPNRTENASEQNLREQLLAQVHSPRAHQHHLENMQHSSSASPHDHNNIDPAIANSGLMSTSAESGGDDNGVDGRKGGKRELSTSKRAAQNRAAQRAFRQRKEGYIKKLEEQVRDYALLSDNYKAVQAENYQLRDYIINLQSRLIESQGEFPQPPSNIDLAQPRSSEHMQPQPQQQQQQQQQPSAPPATAGMGPSAVSQLQASAAQAVADLGSGKHHHEEAAYLTGSDFPSKRVRGGDPEADRPPGIKGESNGTAVAV